MMPDDPLNPISEMMGGMLSLHEVFLSMQEAGFTEDQALRMLAYMLTAQQRGDNA